MDRDGFIRTLSRFGQIYDSGREHGFIDWFREWFKQRNIIIMDDNYIGNGSNNANGFKIDRYFLDTCSAYNSSHSK
jgi:hypothetical protein